MVRMRSESSHVYAGRALRAGEEFDCEPQHVYLMTALGCARKVEQVYQTRELKLKRVKK